MSFTKLIQAALLLLVGLVAVPSVWAQTYTVLAATADGTQLRERGGAAFPDTTFNQATPLTLHLQDDGSVAAGERMCVAVVGTDGAHKSAAAPKPS